MRGIARAVVRKTIGVLPFFEYRLQLLRAPATWRTTRRERACVRRVRAIWPSPLTADIVTIIPTYKRPEACASAIASALAQTVVDHAVLVIDDGAGQLPTVPDDPRLRLVSLPINLGVVGAVRNVGIRISSSRYVAFLDDDNSWEATHLERALVALEGGAEAAYLGLQRVDPAGRRLDVLNEPFDRHRLRSESFVDASTIVVRRHRRLAFSRVPRLYRDFPREDWSFIWRFSRRHRVAHVDALTVRYLVHEHSHYTSWQDSFPADQPPP